MEYILKVGDIVKISKEAVVSNRANLFADFEGLYEVTKQLDIGEPAYHVRHVDTNYKVFVAEDKEYAFVDEELFIVCQQHKLCGDD